MTSQVCMPSKERKLKIKEVEKPGKLANDLNGYKKKNILDLPGLSPEMVAGWIK